MSQASEHQQSRVSILEQFLFVAALYTGLGLHSSLAQSLGLFAPWKLQFLPM